jgi:Golgi nucleoside diphosphatase
VSFAIFPQPSPAYPTSRLSISTLTLRYCAAHYGVILDAGSSGTRVYVYKWKNPARTSRTTSIEDLHRLPKLKLKESKKIHPGVSTFANRPGAVGKEHLRELINVALNRIPKDKVAETPIFLLATAGVRFLPNSEQKALLAGICSWLQKETVFDLADCKQNVQVISGETEGLYGWIAANYLLGGFNHPQAEGPGQGHHHTYGFLDMGGASAQIAFAPNATEAKKHADDLKLVRMRHMDGTPAEYKVFTTTWLGFGANKARERFVESLHEQYGNANELPDPCLPMGLRTTLEGDPVEDAEPSDEQTLVGTGQFDECLRLTYPLLEKNAPCDDNPCLFNGQHVPAIDFNVNHFVGVSEYWHTTHGVFGGKDKAYDLETYQRSVMDFCSRDWSDIEADVLDKRKKSPEKKAEDARDACFKASWLINMLYDGIGIPRVGLEIPSGANTTFEPVKGYEDSFQPVNKIDGVELSWTLGKMVLYASGQVPSRGEPLPVGFGSNVPSGEPDDFENAGSIPLFPVSGMDGSEDDDDDDDDDDFLHAAKSSHGAAFVIFVILIFLAVLLLRRPERRRRLFGFARRRKSGAGQKPSKPSRGFSLASKLFGRGSHQYERVMEEGEASEFELHGVESDETEHSDSSDGSGAPRASGLLTPRLQAGRFADELRPASALDRQGLVVRTESRERLAGVGRRSRAGSPQRQKSALSPRRPD